MTRALSILALALAASCSPQDTPTPETVAEEPATPDPAEIERQKQAEQKAAFEAAAGDETKIEELAEAGNGFALYHRGRARLDSSEYIEQQGGFHDMEAAAEAGNADAQLWLGEKMAYGRMGYPLKPNSGLMMMEKAANQDHLDAILAVAQMYENDTFMGDLSKAKAWYERAVELGSDEAKDALARLEAPEGL